MHQADTPAPSPTALPTSLAVEEPIYPVRVSENGRYFVDRDGRPVFWLGTTQWQIFREHTLEEARTILAGVKRNGFVFIQAMLAGVGDGTQPNVYGEKPWLDDNPLTPNPAYFENVDAVIRIAGEQNLILSLMLYHQQWRQRITLENARGWARWLAGRYRDTPHLIWSTAPRAEPEYVPVLRELAAGLREGDGGFHLITLLPDPSPYSSSFLHEESWLDFNSTQTWKDVELIVPMVTHDYNLKPVKPVLMAEGAYEAGTEYGFEVSPLWVRRQADHSYLCGAHFGYGHNDSWRVLPTWKDALDAPGAIQMRYLKEAFLDQQEWWRLVPDQTIFAAGGNTAGILLNLAARHQDGKWVMVYLAASASVSLHLNKLAGDHATATWFDPRTGQTTASGRSPTTGTQPFTTPEGWEDALLILEAAAGQSVRATEVAATKPQSPPARTHLSESAQADFALL